MNKNIAFVNNTDGGVFMKKYKHKSKKKPTDRVGFYIALSICVVAVALAVWSTYTSINEYVNGPQKEYTATLIEETSPVSVDTTGVTEELTENPTEEQTQGETRDAEISLYETSTLPDTEDVDATSSLDDLSPVFKVNESLIYPVDSKSVSQEYSEDAIYNSTMNDFRPHTGTDFLANEGEKVYAMSDGTVSSISFDEHYGVVIEVTNGEYTIYYCGVDSETNVRMKDKVKQGDVIGKVGQIPFESEVHPHLHVEIKVGDKYIDPLTVIKSNE